MIACCSLRSGPASAGRGRGVAAVYNRYYLNERNTALDAWSNYIKDLLNPAPANLVPMRPSVRSSVNRVRI
jgi:hypothetical protein